MFLLIIYLQLHVDRGGNTFQRHSSRDLESNMPTPSRRGRQAKKEKPLPLCKRRQAGNNTPVINLTQKTAGSTPY